MTVRDDGEWEWEEGVEAYRWGREEEIWRKEKKKRETRANLITINEGIFKKQIDCQFFCGLCEIKVPYKMDGALPLGFYPPVKLKMPLAQSRDELITSMCHFTPALDIVCLTRTDVRRSARPMGLSVFISKMWAEMSSELTFDCPCQRSSSLGQCPTYSITCSSHLENQSNVWEHWHWQIELLRNAPTCMKQTCPEISQFTVLINHFCSFNRLNLNKIVITKREGVGWNKIHAI